MPIPQFLAELRDKVGHELILVPTVVVIARDAQGRLLLVHDRDSERWTLPGGIIEPGETPADAAVREVWEETQLLVTLTRIVAVVGGPGCETVYRNGDRLAWVATVFGASVDGGVPVADGIEISVARLVTPDLVASLNLKADSLRFLAAEGHPDGGAGFEPPTWRPER